MGIVLFLRSARNFEQNKIARGEWDEDGPINPSDPPPNFYPRQLTGLRTIEVLNEMSVDDDATTFESTDTGESDAGPTDSPPTDPT